MGAGNRMSAKWVAALALSLRLRPGQTALELRGRQSVWKAYIVFAVCNVPHIITALWLQCMPFVFDFYAWMQRTGLAMKAQKYWRHGWSQTLP